MGKKCTSILMFFMLISVFSWSILFAGAEREAWDCPECGRAGNTGNYCGGCAHPAPWLDVKAEEEIIIGSIIHFGHFEQDNNTSNGKEEIEWIVLDIKNGNALLISRYGLDAKQYNRTRTDVTWETCSLRTWLNSDFLSNAFDKEEQSAILTTIVDNSVSQQYVDGLEGWHATGGNNTQDSIFLLSYAEANQYLGVQDYLIPGAKAHMAPMASTVPTAYAINNGAGNATVDEIMFGFWWLRSPGSYQNCVFNVGIDGCSFNYVDETWCIVRPAMWVDLNLAII